MSLTANVSRLNISSKRLIWIILKDVGKTSKSKVFENEEFKKVCEYK